MALTVVAGALGACAAYTPKFLLCDCIRPERPIRVFVSPEEDLVGQYTEKLDFFDVDPLGEHIRRALAGAEVQLLAKPTYHSAPVPRPRPNPLQVVSDASEADLVVEIGVDRFSYESAGAIRDRILDYHFWGILGLPLAGEAPRGIIGAACRAIPRDGVSLRSLSFDVVGLSPAGLAKEDAYEAAMADAARVFVFQLLRTEDTGPAGLAWVAQDRGGQP